jgi:hypothetical protein
MRDFVDVDAQTVQRLVEEMATHGIAVLEGALSEEQLQRGRDYIQGEVRRRPHEYFAIHGMNTLAETLFETLGKAPTFLHTLDQLCQNGLQNPPRSKDMSLELRCVQGRSGRRESYYFHYDAAVLTALVPFYIPTEEGNCGDFITFPNRRPVRASLLLNVLEKALLQNSLSQRLVALAIRLGLLEPLKVKLVPGNVYFFWGYRSLHANEPCDPQLLRATALYHFGNPHAGSWFARQFMARNIRTANRRRGALQGHT